GQVLSCLSRSIIAFLKAIKKHVLSFVRELRRKFSLKLRTVIHVLNVFELNRSAVSRKKVNEYKIETIFKTLFEHFTRDFVFHRVPSLIVIDPSKILRNIKNVELKMSENI